MRHAAGSSVSTWPRSRGEGAWGDGGSQLPVMRPVRAEQTVLSGRQLAGNWDTVWEVPVHDGMPTVYKSLHFSGPLFAFL